MWIRALYLVIPLILLNACQARLQSASQAWDQPKPRLVSHGAAFPAKPRLLVAGPVPQATAAPAQSTHWKVSPPELQSSAQQLPISSKDQLLSGFWERQETVVEIARQYLGVPYRLGGETPEEGFDCSGLVQYVFSRKGIRLTRLANEQFLQGQPVPREALQPGDLVFFSISGQGIDHVGIYSGEQVFIHAPRSGRVVSFDRLDSSYFSSRFQGARRIS